jgi:hypothetical protein
MPSSLTHTLTLALLGLLCPVRAGSEDTFTLQKWEYCAGCKLTVEHFFRQVPLTHSLTHSLTHNHSLTHSFSHSLTPPHSHTQWNAPSH